MPDKYHRRPSDALLRSPPQEAETALMPQPECGGHVCPYADSIRDHRRRIISLETEGRTDAMLLASLETTVQHLDSTVQELRHVLHGERERREAREADEAKRGRIDLRAIAIDLALWVGKGALALVGLALLWALLKGGILAAMLPAGAVS